MISSSGSWFGIERLELISAADPSPPPYCAPVSDPEVPLPPGHCWFSLALHPPRHWSDPPRFLFQTLYGWNAFGCFMSNPGRFPLHKKVLAMTIQFFSIVIEVEPFKTWSFINAFTYQSVCQISWEYKLGISANPGIWSSEFSSASSVTESGRTSLEGLGHG